MNNSLKNILYFAITIAVLLIVVKFFIFIIPYILVGALLIFIYRKIRQVFSKKNNDDYINNMDYANDNNGSTIDDNDNSEVIDVDYKEVK